MVLKIVELRGIQTQKCQPRVLLRFNERPPQMLLEVLRKFGKYRKTAGPSPGWYLEDFNGFRRKLIALGLDDWAERMKKTTTPLNKAYTRTNAGYKVHKSPTTRAMTRRAASSPHRDRL